ncbi:MAG: SDR family NAD(P)-dependent oxidoreductase [Chloroflexota bacterium]
MKSVVITGVSTGIGRYAAEYLIKQGFQVFGSIRNSSDGEALQAQFGERFIPLLFDVTDEVAIKQAALTVTDYLAGATLSGLVNNAGIAIPGPLMHLPMSELRHQFEVNVFGLMAVTQAFLPCLGAKLPQVEIPGRIVNISSVAGKMTFPFLGSYASSKHALESL